ncbi:hypothetical protein PFISCL1PPCAC_17896, partial [Pristionchus fissidentatus]
FSEFSAVFDGLFQQFKTAFEAGDAVAAAAIYDEHAVVVDKKEGKSFYGLTEIAQMTQHLIDMGKMEFALPRIAISDVSDDRFFVESDFEMKVVASGVKMTGIATQIYEKRGAEWKCVYEWREDWCDSHSVIEGRRKMAGCDKFAPIYEAIVKKNVEAYEAGNIDAAAEMYDEHAVVVSKRDGKTFYGNEEIKKMIEGWVKLGKIDFKTPRKEIYAVGENRFYVDADIESKIVASGVEMKGSFSQLYEKRGNSYKCVYECYTLQ